MTTEDRESGAPASVQGAPAAVGTAASDRSLLRQYVERRDDAAFTALVRRYGPLVLGVCRRVLCHAQDAEDAFQATFLVLASQAGVIREGASVGGWLYRVAYRIARKLKGQRSRRQGRERQVCEVPAGEPAPDWERYDLRRLLDEEVSRLPRLYRLPIVLCYLDGQTTEEAARHLACPVGTLTSRLARARVRLRVRLTRRGVTLSTGLLAGALAAHAGPVVVPAPLTEATIQVALRFAAGPAAVAGVVSAQLARAYLRRVFLRKLLLGAAGALVLGVTLALVWWLFLLPRPDRSDHA